MKKIFAVLITLSAMLIYGKLHAQLSITTLSSNYTISFENNVAGINNDTIKGTGFTPSPAVGQFDSDGWAATGWSDGNMNFGDTRTTANTDYTRGKSNGGVGTGGFYAFKVATNDNGFGIQPGGSDWAPGTLTLRIINNTGATITSISVSYNIYVRNDMPRGNSFNFSYSSDNATYTNVSALDYTSPAAADPSPTWVSNARSTTISSLNISNGSYFYIRWNGADVSGTGARDEFALNDVVINASGVVSIEDPSNFNATTFSDTQINLSWGLNSSSDSVLIASNTSYTFGTPTTIYYVGDPVSGGGTVIYKGIGTSFSHTSLGSNTNYYYKAWSIENLSHYSVGVTDSAKTYATEPSNHPTGMTANANGPTRITVSWTDSDAAKYLVKGSSTGYGDIAVPIDGTPEANGALVNNVASGTQSYQFTGLTPNTAYYFKIFPYNGSGNAVNYKTDGIVPQASATTYNLDFKLLISEVVDPYDDFNARFVEIYNSGITSIDFSTIPVYLCRQANGNPASWASLQLTGVISASGSYVVANDSVVFNTKYGYLPEMDNSFLVTGNGNDGYYLFYDGNYSTGYRLDAYGVVNQDGAGMSWEYTDGRAVRKRAVSSPNHTWTSSEWMVMTAALFDTVNTNQMTPGVHKGTVTWQGTFSTNWNEKGTNWSGTNGYVPDASYNVTVPVTSNQPVVVKPSACNDVNMQSGATITISGTGRLKIVGQTP